MSQPAPEAGGDAEARAASPGGPPSDRYGTRPRKRRRWVVPALGVVVVLAGLGVAYLGYQKYGPDDIEAEQLGYVVVDDSTMTIRLKVTRADPQRPVVCFVRAMARDGSELGRREVLVEPSGSGTVELTTVVRSSARPASGSVYACSDQVPGYLRAG
ncbi:DUF4307 domain-containing protein [Nocardia abscessus]|uniref:DUF4307 domain-containing protein n=1 Tax=Nocardia TaxID=1817 RepID=UPI0018952B45|nr:MULTISPECIES: DUF4307 domain-containing protein [Nocardia]MBF6217137.1 DUF4307 domain-containing protein [Nocardia abscessus]MDE1670682.1 DUF4307 domain-containing protein [Nocardia gipuzkoensis]